LYQAANLGTNFSDLLVDACQTGSALAARDGQCLRFLTAQVAVVEAIMRFRCGELSEAALLELIKFTH
jgi:hypothetical protein